MHNYFIISILSIIFLTFRKKKKLIKLIKLLNLKMQFINIFINIAIDFVEKEKEKREIDFG